MGLRVHRNGLAEARGTQGHRCGRHLRAEKSASRNGGGVRGGRKNDLVRETASSRLKRGCGNGSGGRKGRGTEYGVVQLSPHPRRYLGEAIDRRGASGQGF